MKDDSALLELRAEFVATFAHRKQELAERLDEFKRLRAQGREAQAREVGLAIHVVAHKLAGAAATYGLKALGSVAEALDDLLGAELAGRGGTESTLDLLPGRAEVLSRALGEAYAAKGDSPKAASSPEAKKLIFDAESLLSEANS